MKSTIYLDADFNFLLLENEESEYTQIFINLTTSDATNQRFEISVAGGATVTETIPSEAIVNFQLSQEYWADDGATTITPKNDDLTGEAMTIHFPAVFDTAGSLNYISDTEFELGVQSEAYANSGGVSGGAGGYVGGGSDFVEAIRNIGFRLLDEPTNVNLLFDPITSEVSLKWKDPTDIVSNEPAPATWAGTVVVRKEGSAPRHKWDGVLLVDSTTRDAYESAALIDSTTEENKTYYYGIFPYDTKGDYRFTKVVSLRAKPEVKTNIFVNGVFNADIMAESFALNNYEEVKATTPHDVVTVSALTQYYLSDKTLRAEYYFGEPFYQTGDYIRKDATKGDLISTTGEPVGYTSTRAYLPIKRTVNAIRIEFDGETIQNNGLQYVGAEDFNIVSIGAGAVVNGEMREIYSQTQASVPDWTHISFDVSSLPYVDYIIIHGSDGSPAYKNIVIVTQ